MYKSASIASSQNLIGSCASSSITLMSTLAIQIKRSTGPFQCEEATVVDYASTPSLILQSLAALRSSKALSNRTRLTFFSVQRSTPIFQSLSAQQASLLSLSSSTYSLLEQILMISRNYLFLRIVAKNSLATSN